jgi:pyruvate formate lyase activating enzyme
LIRARQVGLDAGLRFVYIGNVHDPKRESTYCPDCGLLLIERDWYNLGRYAVVDGKCGGCGGRLPGVFESEPGHWGRRRLPVRLGRS